MLIRGVHARGFQVGLNVSAGLVFSNEAHVVSAAIGGQGVVLMCRQLIEDELREGRVVQPFGPEVDGKPFFLVYPGRWRDEPTTRAVRDWVMVVPGGGFVLVFGMVAAVVSPS